MGDERLAAMARLARHIDDRARLASLDKRCRTGLHDRVHGADIDPEQTVILRKVRLQDGPHVEQRRVVEQHIRSRLADPITTGRKAVAIRQVEPAMFSGAIAGEAVAKVGCQHARPARREMLGGGNANAAIGAGDKAGPAGQVGWCCIQTCLLYTSDAADE